MAVLRSVQRRGDRTPKLAEDPKKTTLTAGAVASPAVRTMSPEMEAYNLDNVSSAAPLALNVQPAPVIETRAFGEDIVSQNPSDPNKPNLARTAPAVLPVGETVEETDQGAAITAAGQGGTLSSELATRRKQIEDEITATQERIANIPASTLAAKERLGINDDNKRLQVLREDLSKVKQDLLTSQDEEIVIGEQGRQRISDFAGTAGDFGQLTNEQLRQNRLDQLVRGRSLSRLGDTVSNIQASINDNVAIINEKAKAEQAKLEFDINQRNKILDRVIQTQGNILSAEQAQRLADTKFNNSILLEREKARLANKAAGASVLAGAGLNSTIVDGYLSAGNPDDRTAMAKLALQNGEITTKDYLTMAKDNAEDKLAQQQELDEKKEEVATQNLASDVVIRTSDDMLSSVDKLLAANKEGNLDSILGKFDQYDWIATWSDEAKGLSSALDHIFSSKTVESLAQMKGNPSDKDMAVVEQMAKGGFNRSIDDPASLVKILNSMKESLEDAKIIEASAIKRRNGSVDAMVETMDDVESLLEEEVSAVPEGVDMDKLVAIESGGNYNAVNPTSGAFGKFQFIPSTLNQYANRLGMTEAQAKTPQGQDAMFAEFTKDNVAGLERAGMPISTASVYLAHQQGLGGAKQIYNGNINAEVRNNLLANLPAKYDGATDNQLIQGWFDVFLPQLT